jgi:hypothetical protein
MCDALDRPLGWRERVSLRVHLRICQYCRMALKHFRFLQEAGERWLARRESALADRHLSDEARQRILQRLREPG